MRCSICGETGHNARTCPQKEASSERSHALWMKVDNITPKEASDLQIAFQKDKELNCTVRERYSGQRISKGVAKQN